MSTQYESVTEILLRRYKIIAQPGKVCRCPFCCEMTFRVNKEDTSGRCENVADCREIIRRRRTNTEVFMPWDHLDSPLESARQKHPDLMALKERALKAHKRRERNLALARKDVRGKLCKSSKQKGRQASTG